MSRKKKFDSLLFDSVAQEKLGNKLKVPFD